MLVTVKPARLASMPQANPVGPAPITTTSKEDCSAVSGVLRSMSLGYREQQRADFHDALPPSVILRACDFFDFPHLATLNTKGLGGRNREKFNKVTNPERSDRRERSRRTPFQSESRL